MQLTGYCSSSFLSIGKVVYEIGPSFVKDTQ